MGEFVWLRQRHRRAHGTAGCWEEAGGTTVSKKWESHLTPKNAKRKSDPAKVTLEGHFRRVTFSLGIFSVGGPRTFSNSPFSTFLGTPDWILLPSNTTICRSLASSHGTRPVRLGSMSVSLGMSQISVKNANAITTNPLERSLEGQIMLGRRLIDIPRLTCAGRARLRSMAK